MPNLDGIQSTRLIRGMGYSAPIVALTAFAEESNVKECMDSGMDFFLPKPIRRPALKQVLKRYCATIPEAAEEHEKDSRPANEESVSPLSWVTNPHKEISGVPTKSLRRFSSVEVRASIRRWCRLHKAPQGSGFPRFLIASTMRSRGSKQFAESFMGMAYILSSRSYITIQNIPLPVHDRGKPEMNLLYLYRHLILDITVLRYRIIIVALVGEVLAS